MNKKITYKGYELLEAMQKGIYQDGTKFILDKISKQYIFFTKIATGESESLWLYRKDGEKIFKVRKLDTEDLIINTFILAEDNTEDENENNLEGFEEFGEKLGKIYLDILKGFKKAFENELRKEKE